MSDLLSIGMSGLHAAKKSIQTASHNIANVNTEGFTKKNVQKQPGPPVSRDGLIVGTGVRVTGITRNFDPHVERKLNLATTEYGFYKEKMDQLSQVEEIFNELEVVGINQTLNDFYNSFRELSNYPEDETMRSIVRDKAQLVVNNIRKVRESVDNLSYNIDKRIERKLSEFNHLLQDIADLNIQISRLEIGMDHQDSDLKDERDRKIRQLSEFVKVQVHEEDLGMVGIIGVGLGPLVSKGKAEKLVVKTHTKEASSNGLDGAAEIHFKSRPSQYISSSFTSGLFGGIFSVRNIDHRNLRESVDNIAYELVQMVNAVHKDGYVGRTIPLDSYDRPVEEDSLGVTTGVHFFTPLESKEDAALSIDLSEEVRRDLSNIVTALDPNSPRDNRVALGITSLQHKKMMENGTSTLEEYYLKNIARIGLELSKAKTETTQAEGIVAMARNLRERISGVSIDEEAADLARFQQAYKASTKIISTVEEMFNAVLGIKRP